MNTGMLYHYKFEVTRIVDGDTVDGNVDLGFNIKMHKRVRLFGIDAPENRTLDLEEKARGIAAAEWLREILMDDADGKVILTTERDATGKYGRLLGTLMSYDVNINELMIQEGHAIPYR